jgi:hypothetical protein
MATICSWPIRVACRNAADQGLGIPKRGEQWLGRCDPCQMTEVPTVDLSQPYLAAAAVLDRHGRLSVMLVADASAVLQDLRHAVQNRELGIVGRLALLGAIHMPAEMVAEVEQHIADLEGPRASGEELRAMWAAHYLSGIKVHDDVGEAACPEAVKHRRMYPGGECNPGRQPIPVSENRQGGQEWRY